MPRSFARTIVDVAQLAGIQLPGELALIQGVPLDAGVTLLFAPQRDLESTDLEAIQAAAAPLLKLLEKRRLL